MSHCLVTFLGRVSREQDSGEYKRAEYHFPDGHTERSAFVGFPLRTWLGADRLAIFGTAGSMWDHLFEGDLPIEGADDERLALIDDVEAENVQQDRLDRLTPYLADYLGCEVRLQIIPTALEPAEQTQLIQLLSDTVGGANRLSLDVTHSFRHLPMLAFTAALYLRALRPELAIDGPWYGALDPDTQTASVHNLKGLLDTADWLSALQRHEWLGDYEGIADEVEKNGRNTLAGKLQDASHFLNIHQEYKARNYIREIRTELQQTPMTGPGALFQPALLDRMAWVDEKSRFSRQRRNALDALARKDYMRAALIGREACITKWTEEYFGNPDDVFDQDRRSEAVNLFHNDAAPEEKKAFSQLNGIRIVIAHANRPEHDNKRTEDAVKNAIKSPGSLHRALQANFDILLGGYSK